MLWLGHFRRPDWGLLSIKSLWRIIILMIRRQLKKKKKLKDLCAGGQIEDRIKVTERE